MIFNLPPQKCILLIPFLLIIQTIFGQHDKFYKLEIEQKEKDNNLLKSKRQSETDSTVVFLFHNHKLSLRTEHQPSDDFVNEQDIDYELNHKGLSLQTGYGFVYDPFSPEGSFKISDQHITTTYQTEKRVIYRNHRAYANLQYDITPKNRLILNNQFDFYHTGITDNTINEDFDQDIYINNKTKELQISLVWEHTLNSKNKLTIGGVEHYKSTDLLETKASNYENDNRDIKINIPGLSGFINWKVHGDWGTTVSKVGYDYFNAKEASTNTLNNTADFNYKENLIRLQIEHFISLSKIYHLNFEAQAEHENIHREYLKQDNRLEKPQKNRAANFMFDFSFLVTPNKEKVYQISLQKSIIRPTYSQVSPINHIYSDLINKVGNSDLKPTKDYKLLFFIQQKALLFETHVGYQSNAILPYYDIDENQLTFTFNNYKNTFQVGGNASFNRHFFDDIWGMNIGFKWAYNNIKNSSNPIGSGLGLNFEFDQEIDLGQNWSTGMEFTFQSTQKNNIVKQINTSQLDLFVEKGLGQRWKVALFWEDVFKTHRRWKEFFIDNQNFSRNIYRDANTFGIAVNYNIIGRHFKHQTIKKPDNKLIKRSN